MFADAWLLILACAALVATAFVVWRAACSCRSPAADWTPRELRGATLAYVESKFRSAGDTPIVANVDRGYRGHHGRITLVELKTRRTDRTYLSDVIELSAQRLALEGTTGEQVDSFGFVVVQSGLRHRPHRVRLMTRHSTLDLALRRASLLNGEALPRPVSNRKLCASCAYRGRCHPKG